MPKFTTISPTCLAGGNPDAWKLFRDGNYAAIGWCYKHDLTGLAIDDIRQLVQQIPENACDESDVQDGLNSFPVFWELCERGSNGEGDIIAVKNNRHGLFGVGVVTSGYKYDESKHETGVAGHVYPHYVEVNWVHTDYIASDSLEFNSDSMWKPYGTMGQMFDEVPDYILPYLNGVAERA